MKTISKAKLLSQLEQQTETHLAMAVSRFQNLPESVLLKPASDGGWSIAQCLAHLNSYGDFYLRAMQHAIHHPKGNSSRQEFQSGWLGNYFTKMMQPGLTGKKYKSPKNHLPPPQLNAYEVVAVFIQQQEQLIRLLRKANNVDINATRVPISLTKWVKLKLGDTFRFFIAHNERHIVQANKNL